MSNLTDFFPSTGESGLSVDPLDMRRYLYATNQIHTKYGVYYYSTASNGTATFWDVYNFNSGEWAESIQGSYVNLIDITSSTNGGYLLNCIGRNIGSTEYCNFKITVDGKETIVPFDRTTGVNNYTGDMTPVLGNISPGQSNVVNNAAPTTTNNMPNHAFVYDMYRPGSYQVSANGFVTNNRLYAYGVAPVRTMDNYHMGIKFNETLKVDIQTDAPNSTSIGNRIAAQYQLR